MFFILKCKAFFGPHDVQNRTEIILITGYCFLCIYFVILYTAVIIHQTLFVDNKQLKFPLEISSYLFAYLKQTISMQAD